MICFLVGIPDGLGTINEHILTQNYPRACGVENAWSITSIHKHLVWFVVGTGGNPFQYVFRNVQDERSASDVGDSWYLTYAKQGPKRFIRHMCFSLYFQVHHEIILNGRATFLSR